MTASPISPVLPASDDAEGADGDPGAAEDGIERCQACGMTLNGHCTTERREGGEKVVSGGGGGLDLRWQGCPVEGDAGRRGKGGHSGGAALMVIGKLAMRCRRGRGGGELRLGLVGLSRASGVSVQERTAKSRHQTGVDSTSVREHPLCF